MARLVGQRLNPKTVDSIINEKIKVLKDFCVVNVRNEESIRNKFIIAIRDNPNRDPNVIVDAIAKSLIVESL